MTKQIERAYRSNRRRSWLLIAAVVALAAAIAIPIASGAAEKTYTLGFDTTSPPTPAQTKTVCAAAATRVDVFLTNTARSVSLGSALVTFPSGATVEIASKSVGGSVSTVSPSGLGTREVLLQSLGLGRGDYVKLVVKVPSSGSSGGPITAIVKQSSNFNDAASNTSNLFSNPGGAPPIWSTLHWAPCGTISGTIWNDQNENGGKDGFENPQTTGSATSSWSVKLYQKPIGGSYSLFSASLTYGGVNGSYTFSNVPFGPDYLVCEVAPSGTTWTQTESATVPGAPATASQCGSDLPKGWTFASFAANATGDFGNAVTVSVTCDATANGNPTFSVQVGSGTNCKLGNSTANYVYEKWTEGTTQVAAFHPVNPSSGCVLTSTSTTPNVCTYFVQRVTWTFATTEQPDRANRSLKYDDVPGPTPLSTIVGYSVEPMLYCKKDPRIAGSDLALQANLGSPATVNSTVLPVNSPVRVDKDLETSCLITSTETAKTNGTIERVDYVFTAVDGRIAAP